MKMSKETLFSIAFLFLILSNIYASIVIANQREIAADEAKRTTEFQNEMLKSLRKLEAELEKKNK
jgi:hypothetical protein